ncbi:unnamed protein product [Cladocopium goreaui]|uniref:Uncharacterized protein n=1 Tax=Cladocopium goreaui TaxID=2562237 RepID=A0A9P1GF31_9DINO|nr:unnamed protein product [Cladocopium goreaui]
MRTHRTPDNLLRFPGETLITVMNQFIEGDYHEELKSALMVMDPAFQIEELNMWKENIPNAQLMSDGQLCKADDKIDELVLSQNKLSFDADALALARDAAQLATLYREEQKTDRSARLAKVLHLKQQNQIGSSLTMDFMRKRRVEDKFSAKSLEPMPTFLRTPRDMIPWLPESQYVVPSNRDNLPTAAEGQRALSALQEQAQLLTGPRMPEAVLASLLQGSTAGQTVGLINLSPYDGCLEKVALRWDQSHPGQMMTTLSLSADLNVDWKAGGTMLGNVRPYDPVPPATESLDLQKYPLKLATVTKDDTKKGWAKYKIALGNEVRSRHMSDPIHGGMWRDLVLDFDKKFCANMAAVQEALVPHEEAPEAAPGPAKWTESEPKNLDSLLETHIIENKIGGRVAGTSLYLTLAKKRDGTETDVVENQKYKLYLVSHQDDLTLSDKEFQIAHGKSSFMKPERVASPRDSDPGKSRMPVNKQPALPLNTFNATGRDKKAQLSPEQVADLRSDISRAMGDVGKVRRKKAAPADAAADAPVSEPVEPSASTKPRAPRGTYARKAAQAVLDSLTTAAPKAKAKASKVSKGKGDSKRGRPAAKSKGTARSSTSKCGKGAVLKRPAGKATAETTANKAGTKKKLDRVSEDSLLAWDSEVDAEDLFGSEKDSDSEMATTQELPGKGDEEEPVASPNSNHEGVSGDEGGSRSDEDSNDESTEKVPKGKDSSKGSCPDMRSLYWSVIHEEQKKIKKSNPEMPGLGAKC